MHTYLCIVVVISRTGSLSVFVCIFLNSFAEFTKFALFSFSVDVSVWNGLNAQRDDLDIHTSLL